MQVLSAIEGRPDSVLVLSVDDGDRSVQPLRRLRLLPAAFVEPPLLCARAALAGLDPPDTSPSSSWGGDAVAAVASFLAGRTGGYAAKSHYDVFENNCFLSSNLEI